MNILPINNVNSQSFKGLWGTTTTKQSSKSGNNVTEIKYQYYPFYDESLEQIQKITETNTSHKESVKDSVLSITDVVVTVMSALPFTSKEFTKYTMNRLPITKQKVIEKHLIGKGLSILKK
jgi:hypothetical protein